MAAQHDTNYRYSHTEQLLQSAKLHWYISQAIMSKVIQKV